MSYERLIPGAGYVQESGTRQALIPGIGYIGEVVATGGATVAVPAGALTLTGNAPSVVTTAHQLIAVPAGSLSLTGNAPTVVASGNRTVDVPAGSLALTANAPIVVASDHKTIAVPVGTLTLTANAPTVVAGITVDVPAGALTLAGSAPAVSVTENKFIAVPAGAVTLTGYAPEVIAIGGGRIPRRSSRKILLNIRGSRFIVPEDELDLWLARKSEDLVAEADKPARVEKKRGKAVLSVKHREPAKIVVKSDDSWVRSIVAQANQRIAERVQRERAIRQAEEEDEELILLMI